MQRKYLENINSDSLIVACITALNSLKKRENTEFVKLCTGSVVGGRRVEGIIERAMDAQKDLLMELKGRASLDGSIDNINDARNTLKKLDAELDPDAAAPQTN